MSVEEVAFLSRLKEDFNVKCLTYFVAVYFYVFPVIKIDLFFAEIVAEFENNILDLAQKWFKSVQYHQFPLSYVMLK